MKLLPAGTAARQYAEFSSTETTVAATPTSNPKKPLSQPEYPDASQRLRETGTVQLTVYVLEDGSVGDAKVLKSSGFPRLDDAAVKEAKRKWRLLPGTQDGKPVAMYGQFAVTFKFDK